MEIYELVTMLAGRTTYPTADEMDVLIAQAAQTIFGNTFPYYNPEGRQAFAVKFLKQFMWHEIGCTPWEKWRMVLLARLAEIMPRYEQLWKSETEKDFQYKPLETINVDYSGDKDRTEDTTFDHTAGQESTQSDVEQSGTQTSAQDSRENDSGTRDASNTWGRQRGDTYSESGHEDGTTGETTGHKEETGKTTVDDDGSLNNTTTKNNLNRYSDTPQNNMPVQADPNGNIILQYLTNVTYDNGTQTDKQTTTKDTTTNTSANADESGTSKTHAMSNDKNSSVTGTAQESHGEAAQATHGMETGESTTASATDTIKGSDFAQREDAQNITDFDYHDDWREKRIGHEPTATYQSLVQQWRDLIIEYDREIMDLCKDCFMLVY